MPISSGAGGKAARLRVNVGGKSRSYWPNATASAGTVAGGGAKSRSTSALNQLPVAVDGRPAAVSSTSSSSVSSMSVTNLATIKPHVSIGQRAMSSDKSKHQPTTHQRPRTATVEKYKQIRHISPPSSHATTSASAFKYFTAPNDYDDGAQAENTENRSRARTDLEAASSQHDIDRGLSTTIFEQGRPGKKSKGKRRDKIMNSLGGQLVITGGHSMAPNSKVQHVEEPPTDDRREQTKRAGLFSSLMTLGATGQKAAPTDQRQQQRQVNHALARSGQHHYHPTINQPPQHNSSQTSLNPSLSFGRGSGGGLATSSSTSSNSNSAANLHSLASLHGLQSRSTQGLTSSASSATVTINKRVSLKYVKTLIILLMSLDLVVTLFVHHFASHDEFSLILTQHRLRFSLVNLVLSAIWFVVLAGAILFDIYAVLLVGAIVDIASFVLLLVCSIIHFTHRIDYNSVNLTSLLLLLFSIIVLHVYLIVIAALTIYLMTAVKRRGTSRGEH